MSSKSKMAARPYRGVSQEERRAERRDKLIAAAITVYGETGYRQSSVKAVCAAAGLTERYFYESFANSEELLVASFNAVAHAVHRESVEAAAGKRNRRTRARAMLHAYFKALQREPLSARVFLVELRGVSPAVDEAFEQSLRRVSQENARILGLDTQDELLLLGVLGGVIQIAYSWIRQCYQPSIDDVTDTALQLTSVLLDKASSKTS